METFGACVLISERPESVTKHLEHVSAGKLYNAAKRVMPGLGADIERLHKIVHPGSGAVYSGFKVVDDKERFVDFKLGLRPALFKRPRRSPSGNIPQFLAGSVVWQRADGRLSTSYCGVQKRRSKCEPGYRLPKNCVKRPKSRKNPHSFPVDSHHKPLYTLYVTQATHFDGLVVAAGQSKCS